jgi:hypothetical protein
MRHNKKPISVINVETGEIIEFGSQTDFARVVSVNRSTINRWKDKNRTLKGVWIYKEATDSTLSIHKDFLLSNGKKKQCRKCQIILSLEVQVCPICNTRQ